MLKASTLSRWKILKRDIAVHCGKYKNSISLGRGVKKIAVSNRTANPQKTRVRKNIKTLSRIALLYYFKFETYDKK